MSLYRQPGRMSMRTLVVVAAAMLVIGLAGGFAIGRASAPKPTLAGKLADLRGALQPASEGLELPATEYRQAVRDGRVAEPTEYRAAQADVQRVRDAVAAARGDLRALGAANAAAFDSAVAAVDAAVRGKAAPSEVQQRADAARAALDAALAAR